MACLKISLKKIFSPNREILYIIELLNPTGFKMMAKMKEG